MQSNHFKSVFQTLGFRVLSVCANKHEQVLKALKKLSG